MARVLWTPAALSDVLVIERYVASLNPAAARRLTAELVVAADSLATFPERGRPGLEEGTRELVAVRPSLVVYRVGRTVSLRGFFACCTERVTEDQAGRSKRPFNDPRPCTPAWA